MFGENLISDTSIFFFVIFYMTSEFKK